MNVYEAQETIFDIYSYILRPLLGELSGWGQPAYKSHDSKAQGAEQNPSSSRVNLSAASQEGGAPGPEKGLPAPPLRPSTSRGQQLPRQGRKMATATALFS